MNFPDIGAISNRFFQSYHTDPPYRYIARAFADDSKVHAVVQPVSETWVVECECHGFYCSVTLIGKHIG